MSSSSSMPGPRRPAAQALYQAIEKRYHDYYGNLDQHPNREEQIRERDRKISICFLDQYQGMVGNALESIP
ncbi:MAG: hypothetical protein ACOYKZ_07385, partial [Chlamydiia bacterium]